MEHYFYFVTGGLDLMPVITHRFPLERWAGAVLTVKHARQTGAVKVLLEPGPRKRKDADAGGFCPGHGAGPDRNGAGRVRPDG